MADFGFLHRSMTGKKVYFSVDKFKNQQLRKNKIPWTELKFKI